MAKKRENTEDNFIYSHFKKALEDLHDIKPYFWFSFSLFLIISIIGFFLPIFFEEKILEILENLVSKTEGLGLIDLIAFIIANNIMSSFFSLILGVFLGVFPIGVIIINAYILGFVANKTVAVEGFLVLWRLLPHGIFEIPAILISISLGIRLGFLLMYNCLKDYNEKIKNFHLVLIMAISLILLPLSFFVYLLYKLTKKNLRVKFLHDIKESIRIFLLIVVPLLVIAGIIEGLLIVLLS